MSADVLFRAKRYRSRWLAMPLLGLAVASSGCAYRTQATGMAVDYNEFVAQTTNRQTVLNVLRASRREPMHFTSFSEVLGNIRGGGSIGTGLALNGDGGSTTATTTNVASTGAGGVVTGGSATAAVANAAVQGVTNITPNLALTVTTGTDFKVAANATDEFYKGILGPIPSATVVNYLRQGFPADLLSHLVIGRLEFFARVTRPGDKKTIFELIATVNNSPDETIEIARFENAIRCRKLDYAASSKTIDPIQVDDLASLGQLTVDQLARVKSQKGPDNRFTYTLSFPDRTDFSLALSKRADGRCGTTQAFLDDRFEENRPLFGLPQRLKTERPAVTRTDQGRARLERSGSAVQPVVGERTFDAATSIRLDSEGFFTPLLPSGWKGDLVIDLTLRSVEGVLYYLGEYIRRDKPPVLLDGTPGVLGCGERCLPILRVLPVGEVPADIRFVHVDYRGTRYAVPLSGDVLNGDGGRSSQSISLVQQLLNLNRSSKDLPATPLVRVIN